MVFEMLLFGLAFGGVVRAFFAAGPEGESVGPRFEVVWRGSAAVGVGAVAVAGAGFEGAFACCGRGGGGMLVDCFFFCLLGWVEGMVADVLVWWK